jgi:hypothetical protein
MLTFLSKDSMRRLRPLASSKTCNGTTSHDHVKASTVLVTACQESYARGFRTNWPAIIEHLICPCFLCLLLCLSQ